MHMFGNDAGIWKRVIGKHGDADVSENGRLLLLLCCKNKLCNANIFFQQRDMHKEGV